MTGLRPMFASVARHHREIARGHQDRALPEVDVERRFGLVVDDAEVEQQVRDGAVAMAGAPLRLVDVLVDRQLAAGDRAEPLEQVLEGAGAVNRACSSAVTVIAPELIIGLNGRLRRRSAARWS